MAQPAPLGAGRPRAWVTDLIRQVHVTHRRGNVQRRPGAARVRTAGPEPAVGQDITEHRTGRWQGVLRFRWAQSWEKIRS
jgi:hypothetical protein